MLSAAELDAGMFEVLWRCLPDRTVSVPTEIVQTLHLAIQLALTEGVTEEATPGAVAANQMSYLGAM